MNIKKSFFAIFTVFLMLFSSACTIIDENKIPDAQKIALEQFGMDKILVTALGTNESFLIKQRTRRGLIYVLGEKDGEEIMIIVPGLKEDPAYEVDFPFVFTFKECIDKLNSSEKGIICEEEDYQWIEFHDTTDSFELYFDNLSAEDVDIVFFITINIFKNNQRNEYNIVQIDNECVIYGEGFTQE